MSRFDSILVVDWSASGTPAPARPSKDAIWLCLARAGRVQEPIYCRTRAEAEARITQIIADERAAGRRILAAFDFPFACPKGVVRQITGSDDALDLWQWLEARITDSATGQNNRFDVAEAMNAQFSGPGPFWGKPDVDRWPGIPYRKEGIGFEDFAEMRACDRVSKAASSCFQLCFPPTVGSQMLVGLPMLARLRRQDGVSVWPFEPWEDKAVVLAEIWPGLIEPAVKRAMADGSPIRDSIQVTLLARALSRLSAEQLGQLMSGLPEAAWQEGWILGAGHAELLQALADEGAPPAPPPLRDDCFAMPAGVHWTPVDDALAALRAGLHPVVRAEQCAVPDAAGRILAGPAIARRANPPTPNSAVDGYGFAHDSLPAGHPVLPLVDERAAAGVPFEGSVPKGHAIRILTGAAIPDGVDTVILEEDTREAAGQIAFRAGIKRGANTRKAGEDVTEGSEILPRARVLTPADLALLAATGLGEVDVFQRLRVAVLSTGDELVEAGGAAGLGQIFDANRPMLLAQLRSWGLEAIDIGRIPDDRAALRAALDDAAARADVILTSGGASAGDEDHVSALLREAGAMQQWRIALKPGRPLALGLWDGAPVFGLPGNPVAALVCTLIFARPALSLLAGAGWQEAQGYDLPAAFNKSKKAGRREYLRARVRNGKAEAFASEGSGRISGLSWAEGLVELPDEAATINIGDPVRYIPFGSFAL